VATRLAAALNYIASHFSDPDLSLAKVAQSLNISPRYLQRLLESSGTSFTTHVTELRLKHAFTLLTAEDLHRRPNLRRRIGGWLFRYFALQSSFPFPLWRYAERRPRTCPNGQHAEPYSLKVRIARHRAEIDDAARAKGSTGQRARRSPRAQIEGGLKCLLILLA
jgi:AraC-like DNA-binding protein